MKRLAFLFGGLGLVIMMGIAFVGRPVLAQNATPSTQDPTDLQQVYVDAVAGELGVTTEALESAMEAGQIAVIDATAETARGRVESGDSLFPRFGKRGDQGRFGNHSILANRAGQSLADMASFIGISEDDLASQLKDGQSLVSIAEANGKTEDELRTYLIQRATEKIDERLQSSGADNEVSNADSASVPESVD